MKIENIIVGEFDKQLEMNHYYLGPFCLLVHENKFHVLWASARVISDLETVQDANGLINLLNVVYWQGATRGMNDERDRH